MSEDEKPYKRPHPDVLAPGEPYPPRGGETVGTSEGSLPRVFPQAPIEERPSIEINPDNTHVVDADELHFHPTVKNFDVEGFIQSVCSVASNEMNKKPFIQINFGNGTAVFSYKKVKGAYDVTQVTGPGVVNDFEEEK